MQRESEISMSKGHTRVQWAMAMLASMSTFTYGLQCGWVSPMTKILQSAESPVGRPLTDGEISLVAALPSVTAMIGTVVLRYVVDKYGRKTGIMIMVVGQLACWMIKLFIPNPTSLLIARLVCGLAAGGCFTVVPIYVKEISQDNIRGTLGSICMLGQYLGILIMYCMGGYLNYYTVLYIVIGLPVITMLMLFKAPESPSFLIKIGKLQEATETVAFLRGLDVDDKQVQSEVDSMNRENDYFKSIPEISFMNIFKNKTWRRGFLIMLMVITVHALNGAFSIINYASILLAYSDIEISPEMQSLSIPMFLTFGIFTTMTLVDRLGRKFFLGMSCLMSALTFAGLATSLLLRENGWYTPGWITILAILVAVFSYGTGVSPIPFIIMSELFNFQIRAKLMASLCILAWGLTFVQLVSFTAITSAFGAHAAFYVFAAINFAGLVLVLVILPETRGKTVEQIESELRKEKGVSEKYTDS